MVINPTVQQPGFTTQPTPLANGVGREEVVRSDLPPIEQAPESAAGQNQQLQNTDKRFQEPLAQSEATESRATEEPASNDEQLEAAGEQSQDQASSRDSENSRAEERALEQQQEQDAAIIRQLKARDREVRLHEAAHAAVGGSFAGAPQLQFERGPDGVNYAVSGEVSISVSPVSGNPELTLEKARQIRAAALAPAEPSAQDRRVAAEASRLESEARAELQQQKAEAEQQRRERVESSREEEFEEEAVSNREEDAVEVEEPIQARSEPSQVAQSQNSEEDDQDNAVGGEEDDQTAKEALEEILLGNQSVPQALNEAGLVDTQNPFGKSGFIEFIV